MTGKGMNAIKETAGGTPGTTVTPERILFAQPSYLGDLILTLPVLRTLESLFPPAEIVSLVREGNEDLVSPPGYPGRVILYKPEGEHAGVRGVAALSRQLGSMGFDCAIVFPGSVKVALAIARARIPRRIGFDPGRQLSLQMKHVRYPSSMHGLPFVGTILMFELLYRYSTLLRARVPPLFTEMPDPREGVHRVARNLGALQYFMDSPPDTMPPPWLTVPQEILRALSSRYPVRGAGRVILAPGATMPTRRWPAELFSRLARKLAADGFEVILLGGEADRELCARIVSGAGAPDVRSVAGGLSPLESLGLVRMSRAVIANDSAPVHMASAVGTPTVALFGPTLPAFGFGPLSPGSRVLEVEGLPCRPCTVYGGTICPVGTLACLTSIGVDEVYAAAIEAIAKNGGVTR